MRIAMVGPPMTGLGGIQQYCRTLKRALEELGHEVITVSKHDVRNWVRAMKADRVIITHRHYLALAFGLCRSDMILLLHGIDAEMFIPFYEQLALTRVKTIWVISEWTKGLAKKFGKPTKVLYLCAS